MKKNRVLLVDDTSSNLDALTNILEDDYDILVANNGKKAIELSKSDYSPDIILLDIIMPEMDGYEVCEIIKSDPQTKDIPIIFITTLSDDAGEAKGLALGAVDYIYKPLNPNLVKARVKNNIELKVYRDELSSLLKDKEDITLFQSKHAETENLIEQIVKERTAYLDKELRRTQYAVDNAGDAIFWVASNASFISVNKKACTKLGYSNEELSNLFVYDIDPDFPLKKWPEFWSQLRDMRTLRTESHHKRKDGHIFPVELSLSFFKFSGDEYVLAVAQDITERKQADEALKQSEEKLKEAQKIAQLGHWELNLVTDKLKWSDEIYRIFEIDPMQFGVSYEAFIELIHPEDRDMVNQAYTDSLKTREAYDIVHRLLMPDGRIKFVREVCDTKFDNKGNPLNSIGTVHDITEIEKMRRKLTDEEDRYHSLVGNIPAIVYRCALDKDWTMEYMSDFTEKITGYPVSDFLQNKVRSYASIIHPDDAEYVEQAVYDGVNSDGRFIIEYRIIDSRGDIHHVFEKGQVIRTISGDVDFLDGIIMDISERKNAEEVLLMKSRLTSMSEILSMISHQWRQPLASISMSANNILMDIELENIEKESLKTGISYITDNIKELSNTLINFENLYELDSKPAKLDFKKIIEKSIASLSDTITSHSIKITASYDVKSSVIGYVDELVEVFNSILKNAVESLIESKTDRPAINISINEDENNIIIEICDNGSGIEKEIIGKIYDPYFSTKSLNALGLGLYMCKMVIEKQMNGSIHINPLKKGVCFIISIPKTI